VFINNIQIKIAVPADAADVRADEPGSAALMYPTGSTRVRLRSLPDAAARAYAAEVLLDAHDRSARLDPWPLLSDGQRSALALRSKNRPVRPRIPMQTDAFVEVVTDTTLYAPTPVRDGATAAEAVLGQMYYTLERYMTTPGDRAARVQYHAGLLETFVGADWEIVPAWRTPSVLGVAARIRETDGYGDVPVLADALQDAGCPEAGPLLVQLRDPALVYRYGSRVFRELLDGTH
jgi:hypothetical protein